MTVCGKATETTNMNSPNRNLNSVNRPSFMITDILSKSSVDKALTTSHSEYLQHLERFSAMNGNRFGLNHGFGMPLPLPVNMDAADRKNNYCESDDDDFHGSDDVDGHSSDDGSNSEYQINSFLSIFVFFFIFFGNGFFCCENSLVLKN